MRRRLCKITNRLSRPGLSGYWPTRRPWCLRVPSKSAACIRRARKKPNLLILAIFKRTILIKNNASVPSYLVGDTASFHFVTKLQVFQKYLPLSGAFFRTPKTHLENTKTDIGATKTELVRREDLVHKQWHGRRCLRPGCLSDEPFFL